jgi:hypothetical protein
VRKAFECFDLDYMGQKILHLLIYLGAVLFVLGVALFFKNHACYAQTPYYGPSSPVPGLIRVEIQAFDDPDLGAVKMDEVIFNGKQIPLKPAGIHGFRGGAHFQVSPGSYDLIWSVSRDCQSCWPRTVRHKQKVQIKKGMTWVQITIQGENATIV